MKIDSHQHFWKYDPVRYSWIDEGMQDIRKNFYPSGLKPLLTQHQIDGCIAIQADQSEMETEFLLDLATKHGFIKGVVGWVDLTADNIGEKLNHFSKNTFFKGVRHTVWDEKGGFMLDPDFQRGIFQLQKHKLTYDILAFDYQLAPAVKLVQGFPGQKFVLDHMGKPFTSGNPSEEWIFQIKKMAANENSFCKISGFYSEANIKLKKQEVFRFLDVVVKAFGVDRIIFGSDWPMCLLKGKFEDVQLILDDYFIGFSESEKAKIFGENAVQFYNLGII